jgi:hypothetical protein
MLMDPSSDVAYGPLREYSRTTNLLSGVFAHLGARPWLLYGVITARGIVTRCCQFRGPSHPLTHPPSPSCGHDPCGGSRLSRITARYLPVQSISLPLWGNGCPLVSNFHGHGRTAAPLACGRTERSRFGLSGPQPASHSIETNRTTDRAYLD